MNITEVIILLNEIKNRYGDREVYLSQDEEGNGFAPLAPTNKERVDTASVNRIVPQKWGWNQDIYEAEAVAPKGAIDIVVLWPDA